jgi:D-beta-D-heptose 7-phosphate kinase/D-beta-D-heptose 1-phosphate adenosyltransferase
MLDRYVYGDAERISPESPVPVLRSVRHETRTGGAGNVAAAVAALGGHVHCVGICGQDPAGDELADLLTAAGADASPLVRMAGRVTTVKTRYVGLAQHRHAQQMLPDDAVRVTLHEAIRAKLGDATALAIEDYDKGVIDPAVTAEIIAEAREAGVPVIVDPARISDYGRYRGCSLLTPNRYEAEMASGVEIKDDKTVAEAARRLIEAADADATVITLDKEGAFLAHRDGDGERIPTRPRSVYDVTGAGDEVLAMLAVAVAGGCDFGQAVALANVAGGLEVERFGVVPITRDEVLQELHRMIGLRGSKLYPRERLAEEIARRRCRGDKVVFTNGCFDILHVGHVTYLQQARELGECLVVAVNTDDSVQRLKGPARPVVPEQERAEMLAALECVDYVTLFDEDTPAEVIEHLRPDVLVKGGTTDYIVGTEFVQSYGGRVLHLPAVEGRSTTNIINRILANGSKA